MTETVQHSQREIVDWFDQNYVRQGFDYLRPLDAYPMFLRLVGAEPGQRLLDIACGPGLLLRSARLLEVEANGIDVSHAALRMARDFVPDAGVAQSNAENLPFADHTFDLVTCTGSIERFVDRERALREMQRVTRPGGRFCFMVRNSRTLAWRVWRRWLGRQNHRGHQDALSFEEWTVLFERLGFRVESVHPDQWFRQRLRRVFRGMRRWDHSRPEPIARPILPLRFANQFVFVMTAGVE